MSTASTEIRINVTGAPEAVRAIQGLRIASGELARSGVAANAGFGASVRASVPATDELRSHILKASGAFYDLRDAEGAAERSLRDVVPPQAEQQLERAARKADSLRSSLEDVGRGLSFGVTAPVLAAGGAATKMAVDFDTSMTKIETLVGVAGDQVAQWRAQILRLAPEVGKTPGELANGLFVVTSAGERGAGAMGLLADAAQASEIGLGETASVARVTTAALQAYADSGLTAQRATEVLLATAREGNFEVTQLASSLGRVLPVASALGVQFDEVGAFVASMTRVNGDAAESVTALRSFLQSLLVPGQQAEQMLGKVGLSTAKLRAEVRDKGLVETLLHLIDAFHGDAAALGQVIPNIEGLVGALATAGVQADSFQKVAESIAGSAGMLDESFQRLKDSPKFDIDQAIANVSVLAVEIGTDLVPALSAMLKTSRPAITVLTDIARVVGDLPGPIQAAIGGFVGVGVAIGPLLYGGANLVRFYGALTKSVKGARKALLGLRAAEIAAGEAGALAGGLSTLGLTLATGGAFAIAVGGAALLLHQLGDAADEAGEKAKQAAENAAKAAKELHDALPTMSLPGVQQEQDLLFQEMQQGEAEVKRLKRELAKPPVEKDSAIGASFGALNGAAGTMDAHSKDADRARTAALRAQLDAAEASLERTRENYRLAVRLNGQRQGLTAPAVPAPGKSTGTPDLGGDDPIGQETDRAKLLITLMGQMSGRGEDTSKVWQQILDLTIRTEEAIRAQGDALTSQRVALNYRSADLFKALMGPRRVADVAGAPTRGRNALGVPIMGPLEHPEIIQAVSVPASPPLHDFSTGVPDAAKDFDQAASIAVSAFGAMAQAAVAGTDQMTLVVINGFTQMAQAAALQFASQSAGPLLGAAIGAVGGLLGALFGGHDRPAPVKVEEYGSRALQQQRKEGPDSVYLQVVSATTGEVLDSFEYQMGRRERRDRTVRLPKNYVLVGGGE